jgi:uncharacterized membrane protein YsdA (DUF1294 family)
MTFEIVAAYLLAVNALTAILFAWDKRQARKAGPRISERPLLTLALIGGTPAAFWAQQILRHKTRKEPFRSQLWLIAGLQALAIAGLIGWRLLAAPPA